MWYKTGMLVAFLGLAGCQAAVPGPQETAGQAVTPASALERTHWQVESIAGRPVIDFITLELAFKEQGRITGFAGCNRLLGNYQLQGSRLVFSKLGVTRSLCAPAVMEQERRLLSELQKVQGFSQPQADQLNLLTPQGQMIRLIKK